ncbi:unnamed protein product [marine sediment metagenome]|uniref:Uncharacterized protein n=1 Tax=marine sediment metagenome TaxID=412755 RepID=X1PPK2_9ZZZZ
MNKRRNERIRSGVEKVTEAPGKKAAAAVEKMRVNINAALDSGRWEAEVGRVTLEEWRSKMLEKGVPRVRAGAEAAKPEMEAFSAALFPHIESQQAKLKAMPSVSLEDNISRMVTFVRGMAEFTWKGRAR